MSDSDPQFTVSRSIDPIALIALVLSVAGVAWQIWIAILGAEIDQLEYDGRLVEFRCNTFDGVRCWEGDGHVAVVLPVYFSNTGGDGYSDALQRVDLALLANTTNAKMLATAFWHGTQNSAQSSTPFRPIVIGARSADGHELRFVGTDPATRLDWSNFVDQIVTGSLASVTLTTTSRFSIESDPIVQTCTVRFSASVVATAKARQSYFASQTDPKKRNRAAKHLTTLCD